MVILVCARLDLKIYNHAAFEFQTSIEVRHVDVPLAMKKTKQPFIKYNLRFPFSPSYAEKCHVHNLCKKTAIFLTSIFSLKLIK